eukprot:CAMPEP_0204293296 /NCGR_PEP_ID=MMETSP0468-20130131/65933_1 /ASSEMBLY_ACC=CAM_ASM_000383 /TAXON_ID=2969 /ORGANISM="Oxyrrhis marina" /LENGTH=98 /DNA_ID=CAMNT_0051271757 /DNA_START=176 /DNA_END=474 /DNA_ORIENTATION=+
MGPWASGRNHPLQIFLSSWASSPDEHDKTMQDPLAAAPWPPQFGSRHCQAVPTPGEQGGLHTVATQLGWIKNGLLPRGSTADDAFQAGTADGKEMSLI